jgi:heme exporter protein C
MNIFLKIAAVGLLMYAAISSFIHPLVPGGLEVSAQTLRPGENRFSFTGYNTHFASDQSVSAYVAVEKNYYCVSDIRVLSNAQFEAVVMLPDTLPGKRVGFYANTATDGTIYVQRAVGLEGFTYTDSTTTGSCKPSVANDAFTGDGFPFQIIIFETIRNLIWHVPMWFTMFLIMGFSFAFSIQVLRRIGRSDGLFQEQSRLQLFTIDTKASVAAATGMLFCVLGLITGSIWARFTWGSWWTNDPQLNGAMVVFLAYAAYFILRSSTADEEKRARLSAIFNIFAFVLMVMLLMVMPRFAEGLHPGKSGNPAFSSYDLDDSLRRVFYPAVIGWMLMGYWIYSLSLRVKKLEIDFDETN